MKTLVIDRSRWDRGRGEGCYNDKKHGSCAMGFYYAQHGEVTFFAEDLFFVPKVAEQAERFQEEHGFHVRSVFAANDHPHMEDEAREAVLTKLFEGSPTQIVFVDSMQEWEDRQKEPDMTWVDDVLKRAQKQAKKAAAALAGLLR